MKQLSMIFAVSLLALSYSMASAQEGAPSATQNTAPVTGAAAAGSESPAAGISTDGATQQVKEIADKVNQNDRAKEVSAGILHQIYQLAEKLESLPFHWGAFALMVTGVVSYALQLVLGKLFVLFKLSISPTEILADALGLVISLLGLVLTTQAAAQNSNFTESPASVLSATAVGAVLGFLFFRWGTAQELSAADGRKAQPTPAPAKPKA